MKYNPEKHHRRSIRLKGYNYSKSGYYFITICAKNKELLFGKIENGKMVLNKYGKIVQDEWINSSKIRKEIELDNFIVMPNHIHGIVIINETEFIKNDINVGANGHLPLHMKPKSISSFIVGFKSIVTKKINILRNTPKLPVWQRNYFEHIIRNNKEMNEIREYIINNPLKWDLDKENPNNVRELIQSHKTKGVKI